MAIRFFSPGARQTPDRFARVAGGLAAAVLSLSLAAGCQAHGRAAAPAQSGGEYDIVILNGRVLDPESGLDAVRHIGISNGTIRQIGTAPLRGRTRIDAARLIVAPGFIDLHSHGQDEENYRLQAADGVTTALELEIGTADVGRWYAEREGAALINHGVSVGHIPVRMQVLGDAGRLVPSGPGATRPATEREVREIRSRIERGLSEGAAAVGFGLQYTPAASRWEVLEVFREAARFGASTHIHIRHMGEREPANSINALQEVISASAIAGAPLHVAHVQSSGLRATPLLLQMIGEAREQGLNITVEAYPYTAGMTAIESAIFDEGWQEVLGVGYGDLEWAATGERLTEESFARYRQGEGYVILHFIPQEVVELAVAHPLTIIASDGGLEGGRGHPRSSGTYARVLGRFVREANALSWMEAIRKMSLMPAQRLEARVPAMRDKGRIRVGADADLVLFDPERVIDRATYQEPALLSEGIRHVLVNGVPVVRDGSLQGGVAPGRPVRAARGGPAR